MLKLIFALVAVAVAVPAGGLLAGVDRRLTARLQSRQGPPLLQPFYDVLKLLGKAPCVTNPWLIFSSYVCLMASAIALLMFFMQGDMLLLFFVMTVGAVFKVAGALSADSPYSNVGAQRELLQMLAYEPLVILTFVGMPAATGSFWFSKMSFPCSMPQSTRPRLFPHSMSVQLPVTSWVAPKKVTFIVNSRVAALPQPFAEEKPPIFTENIIHVPRPSRKTYCIPLLPCGFL